MIEAGVCFGLGTVGGGDGGTEAFRGLKLGVGLLGIEAGLIDFTGVEKT